MNNYSDPMVTYDEIVEALKAIIDCSKANGYLEEYGFLNVKYDSLKQNPIQEEQEQLLLNALQSLEKTINAANKVIRENLEKELAEINTVELFEFTANYEHSGEKRKLASQNDLVIRLKEMSLPLEVLNRIESSEENILPNGFEEIIDEEEDETETLEEPIVEETNEEEFVEEDDDETEEVEETEDEVEETVEDEPEVDEEETEEEQPKVDTNKIQLIKKALDKAREKDNKQLVKVLELQLRKELENLK